MRLCKHQEGRFDWREPALATMERWLLFTSGREHAQMRKLFSHGFTRRAIEKLWPVQERIAAELIGRLQAMESFDAAAQYSTEPAALPMR